MSLGLIGRYGSDSNSSISDSDGEETYKDEEYVHTTAEKDAEELPMCSDPLSLGLEDSEDADDSDSETDAAPASPPEGIGMPLPLPDMDRVVAKNPSYSISGLMTKPTSDGGQMGEGAEENSVFFNPFKKAEEKRLAILKHHVQEFDIKPLVKEDEGHIGARRGYRGSFHSAVPPPTKHDLQPHTRGRIHHSEAGGQMERHLQHYGGERNPHHSGGQMERNPHHSGGQMDRNPHHSGGPMGRNPHGSWEESSRQMGGALCEETTAHELFDDNDSSSLVNKPRKHRSGVTDSLMPPKKFMRSHEKMQAKERPWTLK